MYYVEYRYFNNNDNFLFFTPPPHFNVQMSVTIERSFLDILIEINDFDKFL